MRTSDTADSFDYSLLRYREKVGRYMQTPQPRNKISDLPSSTVSKIVHQDRYLFTPDAAPPLETTTPRVDVRGALQSWSEEKVIEGIPPTRLMLRKKAAIIGASGWLQDSGGHPRRSNSGTSEWQSASLIGMATQGNCQLMHISLHG